MDFVNVELKYVSSGVNPRPHCYDIIEDINILAYASSNVVIIGRINKKVPSFKHIITIKKDEYDITCVKVVYCSKNNVMVLFGDIKGNISISCIELSTNYLDNVESSAAVIGELISLKSYEMPVNWIATSSIYEIEEKKFLVAVGSSESYVVVYSVCDLKPVVINSHLTIKLTDHIPLCGEFMCTNIGNNPLLLIGNDKGELLFCHTMKDQSKYKANVILKLKNHSDWLKVVRTVEITSSLCYANSNEHMNNKNDSNTFYIASAGQDGLIVIYRVTNKSFGKKSCIYNNKASSCSFLWNPNYFDESQHKTWYIYKESVLNGHSESRVTDINWSTHIYKKKLLPNQKIILTSNPESEMTYPYGIELISTAEDRNIIKWCLDRIDDNESVWSDSIRFGMLNVHNSAGFLGCLPYKSAVLSYGDDGAIYMWKSEGYRNQSYKLFYLLSGHTGSVESICWQPESGNFIVTCSKDSTCRIFAEHHDSNYGYCEMARPQIHGFGINCVKILSNGYLVSAAEEKMIRIFSAPLTFYKIYSKYLGGLQYNSSENFNHKPIGAVLRPLGLSNKAVYENDILTDSSKIEYESNSLKEYGQVPAFRALDQSIDNKLLNEEKLQQSTLWPENDKLYGHGNEVLVLEINDKLNLLASSSIANNKETAEIILWNMSDWSIKQKIQQHKLTVTSLKFSPDGYQLLTVSRDRTWALFQYQIYSNDSRFIKKIDSTQTNFSKYKHTRIIWDCDWSYDGLYFATGSRDNTIIIWNIYEIDNLDAFSLKHKHAITSLCFEKYLRSNTDRLAYLLVAGDELGQLFIYTKVPLQFKWEISYIIPQEYCPGKCINDISFKPVKQVPQKSENDITFATASSDHSLRIYSVVCKA